MNRSDGGAKAPKAPPAGGDPRGVFKSKPAPKVLVKVKPDNSVHVTVHPQAVFGKLGRADAPITKAATKAAAQTKRAQARLPAAPKTNPSLPPRAPSATKGLLTAIKAAGNPLNTPNRVGLKLHDNGHYYRTYNRKFLPDVTVPVKLDGTEDKRFLTSSKGMAGQQKAAADDAIHVAGLKVLGQTTRPLHAIAGAADAAVTGKNITSAASRGLANKDHTGFATVLKHLGAPKVVQTVAGTGLDIAADPTTYATFGTGSVVRKAALHAAEEDAVKGVTMKLAGHQVPAVTPTTAAAGKVIKRVADKAPQKVKSAAGGAKNVARDVRPTMAPADVPKREFQQVHDAAAQTRGKISEGTAHAQKVARALQQHVPAKHHAQVIDAIERKTVDELPAHLQKGARFLQAELAKVRQHGLDAGLSINDVQHGAGAGHAVGYFPHANHEALTGGKGIEEPAVKVEGVGRRTPSAGAMRLRTDRRPISDIHAEEPGKFSTDLPLVLANHIASLHTAAARASFNRELAKIGRAVEHDAKPKEGEAIYAIKGANIHEVKPGEGTVEGAQYVALNKKLAESELASVSPINEATAVGHLFNQGNKGFKRVATFTPGFHVRNAIGDTQMAYLSQPGHRILVNAGQSVKVLKEARRQDRALAKLEHPGPSGKTIKVAGKRVPVEDVLKASKDHAAVQTGYIGRELNDLVGRKADGSVKRVAGKGRLTRLMQDRENLMRTATFKHGLDTGKAAGDAARLSRETHIDYGDLTKFERQARRVMPFYTFSARSIPLHAKRLATNPGKFANYEKLRENAATALGLSPGYEGKTETDYQQQQLGIPIKMGGFTYNVAAGLPIVSLNQLPVGKPSQVYTNTRDFLLSMVTPILKDPIELTANKSFFTHQPIQKTMEGDPRVAAPDKLASLIYHKDRGFAQALGIVPDHIDKKTGKKTWGWFGQSDYYARALPGPFNIVKQLLTSGTNQAGQSTGGKVLAATTGIKPSLVDPVNKKIGDLYVQDFKLLTQINGLHGRGISATNPTAEYTRLHNQEKAIAKQINELSTKRGDKIPLKRQGGRPSSSSILSESAPQTNILGGSTPQTNILGGG